MTLDDFLTCSQVARMLGTSRSTVKRLCNDNAFSIHRTPGGHRRIRRAEVLAYLERCSRPPTCPAAAARLTAGRETREDMCEALLRGNVSRAIGIIRSFRAQGRSFAWCADEILAPAMWHVGNCWESGRVQIAEEFVARVCLKEVLDELQRLLPSPANDAPVALGGTCLGDSYELPTRMIRLTLREAGWNAIDLGCQVARQSLVKTATIMNAKIVWLSYSHISNSLDTVEENKRLRTDLPSDARLVVGGQALGAALRRNLQFDFAGDTLQHLRHYANQLRTQMSQAPVCAADLALV